jgi:hypothetical protein
MTIISYGKARVTLLFVFSESFLDMKCVSYLTLNGKAA